MRMRQILSAEGQGVEAAQRDFDAAKDAAGAAKDAADAANNAARKADETMLARGEVLKQKKLLLQTTFKNLEGTPQLFGTAGVVMG